ncbi:MAG: hypothetical protein V1882_11660 [Candidatus Omnitrophota bacterium]
MERKFLSSLGLIIMIVGGIILGRLFESLTPVEAQAPVSVEGPARTIPFDFDWETYVQNYEDLRQAGITTEAKAQQHWMEFGKDEGREYHAIQMAQPTLPVAADPGNTAVTPVMVRQSVSQALLNPSLKIDPNRVREGYDKTLQRVGVKTKEEAMEFSLDFWENKRKTYSL